jgi:hypothetical protein
LALRVFKVSQARLVCPVTLELRVLMDSLELREIKVIPDPLVVLESLDPLVCLV